MSQPSSLPVIVRLFGPLEVSIHGEPIPPPRTRKGKWLFALLALRSGAPVDRDWLAGTLWPDASPAAAPANLRRTLTDLRGVLGPAACRLRSPSRLSLCLDLSGVEVDLIAFDAAIARGDRRSLEQAVDLYRGPLLESCPELWVVPERRHREAGFLAALETLAAHSLTEGDPATAEGYLRRAVAIDSLRETAQRMLMQSLAAGGNYPAALQTYRDLRLRLHGELNIEPDPETRTLFQQLQARVQERHQSVRSTPVSRPVLQEGPSPGGEERPRHNLRHRSTSFIGREQEMAAVRQHLITTRLLTLTGAGGCGKSRLALETGWTLVDELPDGVWLVELASLSDPALVPQQVAAALGVREQPGRSWAEALESALRSKHLLLILDNCEHLLAACVSLIDSLLGGCPELRVLTTSREPMGMLAETTFRIPPLTYPEAEAVLSNPEEFLGYEAVRLFVERARAAQPAFALTPESPDSVARICRHLDGIPLALELAAARLRALPVQTLAERIGDCFHLLTGGNRAALPRHRTLRAMIDWSYHLLSEPHRVLLRRLSVFAGGWTLAAAEAVTCGEAGGSCADCGSSTGPNPIRNGEVLDLLVGLVEKSLVVAEPGGGGASSSTEPRYRMLETVRQYARERLLDAGEAEALRARHLDWFLALARRAEPELWVGNLVTWLGVLSAEHDNLRGALEWGSQNQPASALALAVELMRFWDVRGYGTEGLRACEQALERGRDAPLGLRAKASWRAAWLAFRQGGYRRAYELAEAGLKMSRVVDDRESMAHCLHVLGSIVVAQGEFEEPRPLIEESLAIRRELGDKRGIAISLNLLGLAVEGQGDDAAARTLFQESLAIKREIGLRAQQAVSLVNLGHIALRRQEYAAARALYQESLAIAWEFRDRRVIADGLDGIAVAAGATGAAESAIRLLGAAEALRDVIGAVLTAVNKPDQNRALALGRRTLGEAAFATAWSAGRTMPLEAVVSEALAVGQELP